MASTETSKNIKLLNGGPLDGWWGPYATVALACAAIPNSESLVDGILVNFREGKTVGIKTTKGIIDFHWRLVYTDAGLIPVFEITTASGNQKFNKSVATLITGKDVGADGIEFVSALRGIVRDYPILPNTQYSIYGVPPTGRISFKSSPTTVVRGANMVQVAGKYTFTSGPTESLISLTAYQNSEGISSLDSIMLVLGSAFIAYEAYKETAYKVDAKDLKAAEVAVDARIGSSMVASTKNVSDALGFALEEIGILASDVSKITDKVTFNPQIRQSDAYSYLNFNVEQGEVISYFFGKTNKVIDTIGTFWYKNLSTGALTSDGRIQVLHKRGSTVTKLLDKIIPNSELVKFNTNGIVGGYQNYERTDALSLEQSIQNGDSIMVIQQLASKMRPIWGTTNVSDESGEWNLAGASYRTWRTSTPATTYNDIPALPASDNGSGIVHFYDKQATKVSLPGLEDRVIKLEQGSTGGTIDFEYIAPANIFIVNNHIGADDNIRFQGRKDPSILYPQRFIRDKFNAYINDKDYQIVAKTSVNTANVNQETLNIILGGGGRIAKTIAMNLISVRNTVLAGLRILLEGNADSTFLPRQRNGISIGGGSPIYMCQEIALKNKIDNGGVGFDLVTLGGGMRTPTDPGTYSGQAPFTYKGQTVNMRGFANAYGGWAASTWGRHPFRLWVSNIGGSWDLLGLSTTQGRAYSGSVADKILITKTCYGATAPVISSGSYNLLRTEKQFSRLGWADLGVWSGSAPQIAQVQSWIDGVAAETIKLENFYFDINKAGTNRFSYAKYLANWRTLEDDGITRAAVPGRFVTDVNYFDVCRSNIMINGCGENDRLFLKTSLASAVDDVMELTNEMASQNPNAFVINTLSAIPGDMFPERHPDYLGTFYQDEHNNKYDFYKELSSRFGTLASQVANRKLLSPSWFFQTPLSHIMTSEQISDRGPNEISQVGFDDYNHPGYFANRDLGKVLYAMIAYLKSL